MTAQTYTSDFNAIRGFRRQFAHLSNLSDTMIRVDFVNKEAGAYSISIEAVADYEADRFGDAKVQRIAGVPVLRRSVKAKGATARVRAYFDTLPSGIQRRDAIAAAVAAGFAYCTARTQYQVWKAA